MTEKQKKQLRAEYYAAKNSGEDMLKWCMKKASEYGLTYGQFVTLVGI